MDRSRIVATGAAFGLTIAGLGVAVAAIGGATPTPAAPQEITLAQATDDTAGTTAAGSDADGPEPARRRGGHHVRPRLAVAAATIGVSEEELRTAIRDGQTIAQVAQSNDVAPQQVIDALVAAGKEQLDEAVEAGEMTREHADEHAALLDDHMALFVNETRPHRAAGHGGPGRGRGHGGPRGERPADAPADAPAGAPADAEPTASA